jgi:hypothetical protein
MTILETEERERHRPANVEHQSERKFFAPGPLQSHDDLQWEALVLCKSHVLSQR